MGLRREQNMFYLFSLVSSFMLQTERLITLRNYNILILHLVHRNIFKNNHLSIFFEALYPTASY